MDKLSKLHRKFLMAGPATGVFGIGPKLSILGKGLERNCLLLSLVRPVLRDIALNTGESASLYVREGCERVVLAREEGTHAIRHAISEGQRMDLHAGAAGKVILAFSPEETVAIVLGKTGLPKRTAATITDKKNSPRNWKTSEAEGMRSASGSARPMSAPWLYPSLNMGMRWWAHSAFPAPSAGSPLGFEQVMRSFCWQPA
jgi:DNA-binding IclR family transcriptional regulator